MSRSAWLAALLVVATALWQPCGQLQAPPRIGDGESSRFWDAVVEQLPCPATLEDAPSKFMGTATALAAWPVAAVPDARLVGGVCGEAAPALAARLPLGAIHLRAPPSRQA